ncbi:hypothetical protein ES708_17940 [subsurface metagenome]
MTESRPWRCLWDEINGALARFDASLAKETDAFLMEVRIAVEEYGRAVDPEAFDEYGLPREEEDVEG